MDVGAVEIDKLDSGMEGVESQRELDNLQREYELNQSKVGIDKVANATMKKLIKRQHHMLKKVLLEETKAKMLVKEREKIIGHEFKRVQININSVIKDQREKIMSGFGALTQKKKKSKYTLLNEQNKKINLGFRKKICTPYVIRCKVARCVKDKIPSGFYVVLC